jgi:hypothetical protein
MADVKISQLPQTQSLSPSDILPAVANGVTSKVTFQDLANSISQVSSSISASYALTASYLSNYIEPFPYTGSAQITGSLSVVGQVSVTQDISASSALFTGAIVAQTLVVQTITSSVIYSSGSNTFGDDLTDVQQFTGSVRITGSLSLAGGVASLTSSWAERSISASYAITASIADYSRIQESQYRFQNITVIDQDVWLNSGSIVKVVTSSGVSTAEYSINGGSYTAFSFTGDTWTGNIPVVPKDTLAWRITYRSGFTTGALVVVSNIIVN